MNLFLRVFALTMGLLLGGAAQAQSAFSVDTTPITDGINTVFIAVGAIGPSIVLIYLAIRAYKWIRAALQG